MIQTSILTVEYCVWCRHPVRLCKNSSCDDTGTYGLEVVSGPPRSDAEADAPAERAARVESARVWQATGARDK